jgi:hypothetical protein
VEKIWLLFKHYKIDPNNEQSWQELALSLALAHVPGLQVANRPGRKPTWKTGLYDELVRAVDDVKSRTGKGTKEAIAELRKEPKWKTYPSEKPIPAQSLGARYREARARQKALASLQEDWEKELAALFATAAPLGRPHEVTGRATKSGARAKKKPRRK